MEDEEYEVEVEVEDEEEEEEEESEPAANFRLPSSRTPPSLNRRRQGLKK